MVGLNKFTDKEKRKARRAYKVKDQYKRRAKKSIKYYDTPTWEEDEV